MIDRCMLMCAVLIRLNILLAAYLCSVPAAWADAASVKSTSWSHAEIINPTWIGGASLPRSNIMLLWGSDGSIWRSEKPHEWQRASTHTDADLRAVAANTDASVLIAVGDRGAILRSTDRGLTWSTIAPASSADLRTIVHHAPGNAWIAAGTSGTLMRSRDDGRSWHSLPVQISSSFETSMSDSDEDRIFIAGSDGTIGISDDRGKSWLVQRIDMPGERTPIARLMRFGEDSIVGTSAYGRIVVSRDRGKHWQTIETGARGFFTAAAAAADALWLGTHTGELWRSTEGGSRFDRVSLGLAKSDRYISAIHHDKRTDAIMIAGHGGLLARRDSASWEVLAAPSADLEALVVGTGDRIVVAGAAGLIMESSRADAHWTVVNPALGETMREVLALPNTTFVAVGALGAIVRSTDAGKTWHSIDVRYPNENTPPTFRALHLDRSSNALIAAGPPGTILRSNDEGTSWRLMHWTPLEAEEAFPWLLPLAHDGRVVAIEARGGFYRTDDAGRRWRRAEIAASRELWHGATLRDRNVSIVAGEKGIAALSNDGEKWRIVETGVSVDLYGSFADERDGALFLMGENGVLLRSHDLGETWLSLSSGTNHALRRIVRDPRSGALVAFGAKGAMVRSRDGSTWSPVNSGTRAELRKAVIDPGTGDIIVVGSHGTAIRASDGGMTWHAIATNTRRHFRGATIDERGHLIAVGERIVRIVRTNAASSARTNNK